MTTQQAHGHEDSHSCDETGPKQRRAVRNSGFQVRLTFKSPPLQLVVVQIQASSLTFYHPENRDLKKNRTSSKKMGNKIHTMPLCTVSAQNLWFTVITKVTIVSIFIILSLLLAHPSTVFSIPRPPPLQDLLHQFFRIPTYSSKLQLRSRAFHSDKSLTFFSLYQVTISPI